MILELNMVQTIALAVILLLIGEYLVRKINILSKYCIPAPVVGGMLFAILALILKQSNIMEFQMDGTLQTLTMTMFFTSVGFSASFKLLKKGGIKVPLFLLIAVVLVVLQNLLGIGIAKIFNENPLLGIATGSVPMTGGHGTALALGPDMEEAGFAGASTVAAAAATFGLVAGSMLGGPVGKRLIEKNNLTKKQGTKNLDGTDIEVLEEKDNSLISDNLYMATFQILIAMGIGTIISKLLEDNTNLSFPAYIGAMLAGAIMRNISDSTKIYDTPMVEIDTVGGISLSLFLSMALMSLKLWELADLAIPMIAILLSQVVLMFIFTNLITFNVMGRDYDAAILAAGHCGFGLGATANGIAVMSSVTDAYGPSPTAFFILPLIGSLFIDFFNIGIIATFINFL